MQHSDLEPWSQPGATSSCSSPEPATFHPYCKVVLVLFTGSAQLSATEGVYRRQRRMRQKNNEASHLGLCSFFATCALVGVKPSVAAKEAVKSKRSEAVQQVKHVKRNRLRWRARRSSQSTSSKTRGAFVVLSSTGEPRS